MKTLYEILGVAISATPTQIQHAYQQQLEILQGQEMPASEEDRSIRLKAAREAYQVLSCANRRRSYDEQLRKRRQQRQHQVIERPGFPWAGFLLMAGMLSFGAFHYYKVEAEETARLKLEVARESTALRRAELLAAAEKSRLEAEKYAALRRTEEKALHEMEMVRRKMDRDDMLAAN